MYYPQSRDAERRESERRLAEYDRRAQDIERFADNSRFLIAAHEAKRKGFTHFAEALEKLSKINQTGDKNEA